MRFHRGWRCAVFAAALGGVLAAGSPARRDTPADDRIRQRVETRLSGQVAIHFEGLRVDVADGHVRLHGSVASVGERDRAGRIVLGIVGVSGVTNELSIRESHRSELAIRQEVRRLLDRRPRFRPPAIKVEIAGTEVTLTGQVERALDRLDAERIAAGVTGVTRVFNRIRIHSEGTFTSEAMAARVRSILTNPLTFGVIRDLQVEVQEGTVILRGIAPSDADRQRAERLTLAVPGVTGVVNLIRLP